jgi:hypothetical protein
MTKEEALISLITELVGTVALYDMEESMRLGKRVQQALEQPALQEPVCKECNGSGEIETGIGMMACTDCPPAALVQDDYKTAYIEAMVASNKAGFSGMSAAETIRELDRMVSAPVQEPVGKVIASVPHLRSISVELLPEVPVPPAGSLIYTTAPAAQRQWVGLTDGEIQTTWDSVMDGAVFTRKKVYEAIETKLKEKNT